MKPLGRSSVRRCLMAVSITACALAPAAALGAPVPPNDDFANATDLGSASPASASGSNLWATTEPGEPGSGFGPPTATVWYRWTAPQDAVMRAATCRSTFDTTLAVYRGTALGRLGRVAANDQGCGERSALRFLAVTGTTYHVAVGGFRQAQGAVELRMRALETPPNDDVAAAIDLGTRLPRSVEGTTRDATVEPREPRIAGGPRSATVWYRWTAPEDRTVVVGTCGSRFDTVIGVFAGTVTDDLRPVAANDDACRVQSRTRFRAVEGRSYSIAVAGFRDATGPFELALRGARRAERGIDSGR